MALEGCGPSPPATPSDSVHGADVEAWRQWRYADLRQPDNWLSLVGLYWLREGENTFGGGADNDLVFPGGDLPDRLGVLTVFADSVAATLEDGSGVLADGVAARRVRMTTDAEGDSTVLSLGSLRWYVMQRRDRRGVRLMDAEAPSRRSFQGIDHYPVDVRWRVPARWHAYDPVKIMRVPNILGTVGEQPSAGALVFEVDGATYRLDVQGEPEDERFFVIFADQTNGPGTYEAGRYVWVDAPDEDGWVILDFNKAYNPPCVFTEFATCPLPPSQNRLDVAVTAGEKKFDAGLQ